MQTNTIYLIGADLLLVTHVLFVLFVVGSLLLVIAGGIRGWEWVRNPWFRLAHLVSIGIVVVQAWFGVICFLTNWEMALRAKAGQATYAGTFISHWLGELLYYQAPAWVFAVAYSVFGLLVVLSWLWVRPRPIKEQ